MEDEVFEKIKSIFVFTVDNEKYVAWITPTNEEHCKKQLKQILEEIESNGYEKAIKDFNDLADGKIIMKEAKP